MKSRSERLQAPASTVNAISPAFLLTRQLAESHPDLLRQRLDWVRAFVNPIVTRATGEEALEALHRLTPTASRRLTLLSLRTARMVLSRDTADMQELLDAALDQTTRAILSASEFLDATETILLEHTQAHFEIVLQLMLATLGPDEIAELAASDALWASIEMEALFCWSPCPSDRWVHANLPFIVVLEGLSQPDRQKPALAALTRHAYDNALNLEIWAREQLAEWVAT